VHYSVLVHCNTSSCRAVDMRSSHEVNGVDIDSVGPECTSCKSLFRLPWVAHHLGMFGLSVHSVDMTADAGVELLGAPPAHTPTPTLHDAE